MGEADGIDVVPLHRLEILAHQFFGNVMSRLGIMLVDIHALELDRLAIEEQHVIRPAMSIFLFGRCHLDAAETDVEGNDFDCPLAVLHGQQEFVQIRCFRAPLGYIREHRLEGSPAACARRYPDGVFP